MARRSSAARRNTAQRDTGRTTTRRTSTGTKEVVRKMGRPTALTDRVEETILGLLMQGNSIEAACHLAGVGTSTFYRWMQRGEDARETLDHTGSLPDEEERYRDFREAVLDARAHAEERAVSVVMKAMHGGFVTSEEPIVDIHGVVQTDPNTGEVLYKRSYTPPDGRLALQYLQRARPKDWSQQAANVNAKVEVSGPQGGPVEVVHDAAGLQTIVDRIAAVREEQAREEAEMAAVEAEDIVEGEIVDDER